jgi:Ca2+/Na+ antiporter
LALLLWATVIDSNEEKWRKYYWLTFFSSIVWLGIFVFLMLHMAEAAAEILHINPTVMGLTFCAGWLCVIVLALLCITRVWPCILSQCSLAAGTSAPDALATIYVAREGQGTMAIANALGSNIFDILFGLGLPFLVSTIVDGGDLGTTAWWSMLICSYAHMLICSFSRFLILFFRALFFVCTP